MSILLPCPFCSAEACKSMNPTHNGFEARIDCTQCYAQMVDYGDDLITLEDRLIEAWNRRSWRQQETGVISEMSVRDFQIGMQANKIEILKKQIELMKIGEETTVLKVTSILDE